MLPAAFGTTDPRRRNGRQILAARQTRAVTPESYKVCVPEEIFLSRGNMGRYIGTWQMSCDKRGPYSLFRRLLDLSGHPTTAYLSSNCAAFLFHGHDAS